MKQGRPKYCPHCSSTLALRPVDGHERLACSACDYVFWNNPVPVVAAIVEREGKVLLARKKEWPAGLWALIAGFPEAGETMEEAVLREVREEAGLEGEILGLVGVYSLPGRNQVFIVYRLRAKGGEIRVGEELEGLRECAPEALDALIALLPTQAGAGRALRDWQRIEKLDRVER